jgi:esterase/lipase superfamily enzyme
MVVATTRSRAESPAFLFGGGRSPEASFADMVVSIPPDANRKIGEVQWPQRPPGNPETDFVTLKSEIITRDQATATFSRLLGHSHEREAFVFVHGFNNRFEDAVYRFAQILHDSGAGADVAPILFTWPSAGNVFAYEYDRDSANYSRDALEKLLRYLQDDPEIKTISVLAHSMGNWVTLEALRQMAIRDGRVAPKVKVVLLADADVDVGIAHEQIATLGPDHPHIVLFVSENDRALAVAYAHMNDVLVGQYLASFLSRDTISALGVFVMRRGRGLKVELQVDDICAREPCRHDERVVGVDAIRGLQTDARPADLNLAEEPRSGVGA